jgi:hypothetical protein
VDVDKEKEEAKKNFVNPYSGHSPFFEYLEAGTLKHTPGICRCPDCAWLWAHVERAINVYIADGVEVDFEKLVIAIVTGLHGKGLVGKTLDMKVLVEGICKEMTSLMERKKYGLEETTRRETLRLNRMRAALVNNQADLRPRLAEMN